MEPYPPRISLRTNRSASATFPPSSVGNDPQGGSVSCSFIGRVKPSFIGAFSTAPPRLGLTRRGRIHAAHVLGAKGRGTHMCAGGHAGPPLRAIPSHRSGLTTGTTTKGKPDFCPPAPPATRPSSRRGLRRLFETALRVRGERLRLSARRRRPCGRCRC